MQSIIKYAPIFYFYSNADNFAQYEVLDWYAPTMGVWFGLQLVLIFLQWIFGSRFGMKCAINSKDKEDDGYKYEEQILPQFAVAHFNDYVPPALMKQAAVEAGRDPLDYVQSDLKRTLPIPFHTDPELEEQEQVCCNPTHPHSVFYTQGLSNEQIGSKIYSLKQRQSVLAKCEKLKCFYLVDPKTAGDQQECTICMEGLDLGCPENTYMLCICAGHEKEEQKLI